ncbi:glycosyltransferase family 2 protein [Xanthomonas hortorum pv. vitians]|uniref:Glycosyltransferase n=2 Tax=Xanthomonas hortorum TaxID=56454 RepID=A0A6V7EGJ6_9XANT|nr:glycosyltransferase [Xanthomonas hortorum]MCC4625792.1 glycosyltransferase [Xanthomonas campestris pv. nigromaculans]APP81107.1 glycosyl transferase [Xanthomonas hortorum pv. gardneri]APP85212.1 glycosyl transferase [Xanthomonas hortorum pv. gardneri]ASW44858.1 glycosyl transferase [Xanthomonas hortorum]EGD16665.1 glycosyl transferase [Xanthomonas hortorum ATCC 19865]
MSDQTQPSGRASWPLVSVLIPAYNHARFVQRCLDSVLEDPYPCKEIVIIDDGSSDATGEKIAQWIATHGHRLPVQFVQRDNRGVAATLNELALRARGDYLRIVASDDYLIPGGIKVQVGYLKRNPSKLAVIGDACVVDREGRRLHESAMRDLHRVNKKLYLSENGIRRAVISNWAVSGAVLMLRRNAFDAGMIWDETLRIEDWDLFLRLVARDALAFMDVTVCAYRLHGENVSKTRETNKRLSNLGEFGVVAERSAAMFNDSEYWLLRAQSSLITAKIAFLKKKYFKVLTHVSIYCARSMMALRKPGGGVFR